MDLKCTIESRKGKTQWSEGYQITVGLDGIARNVPDVAAAKLLTNKAVWSEFTGKAATQLPGIQPKAIFGQIAGAQQVPQAPQVVEINAMPESYALLTQLPEPVLHQIAAAFEVDALDHPGVGAVARAIILTADVQLAMQLSRMAENFQAPVEEPPVVDPEPTAPSAPPPRSAPALAVVAGPEIPVATPAVPASPPAAPTAVAVKATAPKQSTAKQPGAPKAPANGKRTQQPAEPPAPVEPPPVAQSEDLF